MAICADFGWKISKLSEENCKVGVLKARELNQGARVGSEKQVINTTNERCWNWNEPAEMGVKRAKACWLADLTVVRRGDMRGEVFDKE
jgi:hypothetical protein